MNEIRFETLNVCPFTDLRRQKMPQQMITRQIAKPTNDTATIANTVMFTHVP